MGTLQYQCSMSLDGFIAGPGGDMSWLTGYLPDQAGVDDELVGRVGALLVGARTFRGDDPNRGTDAEGPYGGQWSGPSIVLTHDIPDRPVENVTFSGDLHEAVATAQEAAGGKLVSVLGADVARQCLAAGLLDEILVTVTPVLLGDGVRLFHEPGGRTVKLETVDVTGLTLTLRVLR
ncbi:dihydrofolate reductase family protein [Saccharomonospora iraqiensis]|uniref:dihydrofolate reductase family protein n=1 Tax=Saccharomonospora iraqiensis TaxID=52698 RepID=UPI000407B2D5|nr:dihydrofolate reductase family protein [Saccharomonospora iraqiensis]